MTQITLTDKDQNDIGRLCGQAYTALSEQDKDLVEQLAQKGLIGPAVYKDNVIYVGNSLLPQQA